MAETLELVPETVFIGFRKAEAMRDCSPRHALSCLLIFLIVSFGTEKFLFLMKFLFFSLITCAFAVISKNPLPDPRS